MPAVGAEGRAEVPLSLWMAGLTLSFSARRGETGQTTAPLRGQLLVPLHSQGSQFKLQEPCTFTGFSGRR